MRKVLITSDVNQKLARVGGCWGDEQADQGIPKYTGQY